MNEKFFSLDQNKQIKILNGAIDEFTSSGYDRASTNVIVKNAGISKGLLFHYFGSKKQLYTFIYNYGLNIIMEQFDKSIDYSIRDILLLLKNIVVTKMKLMRMYPNIFKFFMSCMLDQSEEIKELVDIKKDSRRMKNYEKIYENIDYSLFKDEIDISKAINIIRWTFEQYSISHMQVLKVTNMELNLDMVEAEIYEYIQLFRENFYK